MLQRPEELRSPDGHDGGWGNLSAPKLGERTYRGERGADGRNRVWIETQLDRDDPPQRSELSPCRDRRVDPEAGFAWGYGGSGPSHLALALLVDALGDREMAGRHHQRFKRAQVAQWGGQWSITAEAIQFWVLSQVTREEAPTRPRFHPGSIVATPGVLRRVPSEELLAALTRHLLGDWGELTEQDWRANESALSDGTRLLSAYLAANGERFWIITEADRSVTTSLLPEEY